MSKFTTSGMTKFKNNKTGDSFQIGDYVSSGKIKGIITGVAKDAYIEIDNGKHEVYFDTVKPAERSAEPKPTSAKKPVSSKKRTISECEDVIVTLQRALAECTPKGLIPPFLENATPEVHEKLPEVRATKILTEIQADAKNIVIAAKAGDREEMKKSEKKISQNVEVLKQVAPQDTISFSNGCRVVTAMLYNRKTIRIYFNKIPTQEVINLVGKHYFRSYEETVDGKTEQYWGIFYSDKALRFALDFCGQQEAEEMELERKAVANSKPKYTRSTGQSKPKTSDTNVQVPSAPAAIVPESDPKSEEIVSETKALFLALLKSKGVNI